MQKYVLIIPFDSNLENTIVIYKNRGPAGVKNKINFIGGKVEPLEDVGYAAVREFEEECGLKINKCNMHLLDSVSDGVNYEISTFISIHDNSELCTAHTVTDEAVELKNIKELVSDIEKNKTAYADGFEILLARGVHLARGLITNLVPLSSGVNSTDTLRV